MQLAWPWSLVAIPTVLLRWLEMLRSQRRCAQCSVILFVMNSYIVNMNSYISMMLWIHIWFKMYEFIHSVFHVMNSYLLLIVWIHTLTQLYEFIYSHLCMNSYIRVARLGSRRLDTRSLRRRSLPHQRRRRSLTRQGLPHQRRIHWNLLCLYLLPNNRGNQLLQLLFMELWKLWRNLPLWWWTTTQS